MDREEMGEPGTLIKFGRSEHLLQLQNEELLYMNHLPYFWEVEDEDRGDPVDCIAEVARGPKIGFTLPDGKQIFMEGEWTLRMHPPEHENINIFCMYALRSLIEGTFCALQGDAAGLEGSRFGGKRTFMQLHRLMDDGISIADWT